MDTLIMIQRHLSLQLLEFFRKIRLPGGIILAGTVGVGKTTLIEDLTKQLSELGFQILRYDGDDVSFRTRVSQNSQLFMDEIRENGFEKPFIFVDEVQKEPAVFDAVKMAFDKVGACFIVSGSNPAYLKTEANQRLQRRGEIKTLFPLSISEILQDKKLISEFDFSIFLQLLWKTAKLTKADLPKLGFKEEIPGIVKKYLIRGGHPDAYLSTTTDEAMSYVKLVAERGITQSYHTTIALDDEIRQDLSRQTSREFSYQGIHQRIRSTKRHIVDRVIEHLMNHGYLYKKRPYLNEYEGKKSTYLSAFSWSDPGLVTYYSGDVAPTEQEMGFRLESYVHCQLVNYLEKVPLKSAIYYYKPFEIKPSNNALDFKQGEIDFIVVIGKRVIPIEVKMTKKISEIDTSLICKYVKQHKCNFGIVLYGGAPFIDQEKSILYFPYWGI